MSLETDLESVLKSKCPRTYFETATYGTTMPYVIWERGGGESVQFLDKSLGSKRQALIQITVWDALGAPAFALLSQIEAALLASTALQVSPLSEASSAFSEADDRKGAQQTFSVWGERS